MNVIKSYIVTNAAASSGGGGGSGLTSFTVGNLNPLFTASLGADPLVNPALTFAAVNQNANLVYAGPTNGAAAAPTFRAIVAADLPSDSGAYWKTAGISTLTNDVDVKSSTFILSLLTSDENGGFAIDNVGNQIIYSNGSTQILGIINGAGNDGLKFSDDRVGVNQVGFQEAADYSGNYTDRSYTSKGYVLGAKTFTGIQTFSLTSLYANDTGIDVVATGGSDILNIGTSNADVINIGYSGSTINIQGTLAWQNVTNLQVTDKLFTVNKGGGIGSASSTGFEIEENGIITGWFATNGTRDGWDFRAPGNVFGIATLSLAAITNNRTYTLPDASGTIALTSNIIGPANGGTGVANNAASTITISGNFATTFTVTGVTGVTLPTSGTLATVAGTWATEGTSTLTNSTTIDGAQTLTFDNTTTDFTGTRARFDNTVFAIWNPAKTFIYAFVSGPIVADRSITLPTLAAAGNMLAAHTTDINNTRVPFFSGATGLITASANMTYITNRLHPSYLTLSAGTATAGTCPLVMTSGTNLTVAISGGIEYNNTFHMTNSDATRRHVVLAPNTTKVTAGAPFVNDGYITMNIGGTDVRVMTTA